jgi:FAD/FMN-containing dehydrogenase
VDTLAGQVTAGAGVTIAELRAHAAAAGLEYGVSLASRESATVGGTIAPNAGGVHTLRYGGTRAQLLGLATRRWTRPCSGWPRRMAAQSRPSTG